MSSRDPELAVSARPRAGGSWSWGATYALLALALGWVVLSWAGVLVVVGSTVVPVWAGASALLVACAAIRTALRMSRVPRPPSGTRWRRLITTVTVCAWVLVPLTAAADGFGGQSYVVVEPAGSGGCRVVVVEGGWVGIGWGTVYAADGWGPFARQVGDYRTDDGYQPVSTGAYSISWDTRFGGLLKVDGTLPDSGDPESGSGLFGFDC